MNKLIKPIFFALLFFMVFAACKKNAPHLSAKVMQKVLLDVNLAETYSTIVKDSLHKAGAKNIDSLDVYYKTIFNHYNITQQQFAESLNWYKDHPAELDSMYTHMLATAGKWQSKPVKGLR